MAAYVNGDIEAFEALYERHKSRVFGFLMSKLRDRDEAEDVFQITFTKLHNGRHRYRQDIPFLPWIFTIARNAMIDHLRKKGTHDKHITISAETVDTYAAPDSATAPIQSAFAEFSKLSDNQRQALELRFNQGLTFAEIAEQMQTTADNTRQIISRAIRKLRTLMARKEMK